MHTLILSYFFRAFLVSYDYDIQHDAGRGCKYFRSFGIYSFIDNVHFHWTWEVSSDTDNKKDCLLKFFETEKLNLCITDWFNDIFSIVFDKVLFPVKDTKYPFQIVVICTAYVNCSFKGITSN